MPSYDVRPARREIVEAAAAAGLEAPGHELWLPVPQLGMELKPVVPPPHGAHILVITHNGAGESLTCVTRGARR
jgi:hypothetical protein